MAERLQEYRRKRRFGETPEPDDAPDAPAPPADAPRFVVHEHHATRLHWDLRLEHEGVLASFAIPNGIPDDPRHNRKAVHTEDHPLKYLDFKGTIPEGNYGAGQMTIWDTGTYTCEKWRTDEIIVVFHGDRLRGKYVLFRAGKAEKDWMIHRMDPPVDATAEELPARVEPMLAKAAAMPRDESGWAFEVKWDGIRAIARSLPGRLHLESRNGNDVTAAYPELRALNRALSSHGAVLDGEIVAFDDDGRPSFQALQSRMHARGSHVRRLAEAHPVTYMVFDLLWLDGHSLMDRPLEERRERLEALELDGPHWQVPPAHVGVGRALLAATAQQRLEGVIGKRLGSTYRPGRRTDDWIKVKNEQRQEFVIGGYVPGKGSRAGLMGSLQLGVYDGDGGLHYAGGVGTGFDEATLRGLTAKLRRLERKTSPFVGRQPPKDVVPVTPKLVCEVRFAEWTAEGSIRHGSFQGLRDDKAAEEVVRETPATVADADDRRDAETVPTPAPDAPPTDSPVAPAPAGLPRTGKAAELQVDGRTLKLSNLDKVLYPAAGFTKAQVIEYYARIAPVLIAQHRDHPVTFKRYPNGVDGKAFFEKNATKHRPDWVTTTPVPHARKEGVIDFVLLQDVPTLLWAANLAALELHPSLSHGAPDAPGGVTGPRSLVFDLDPGPGTTIVECCRVGLAIREVLGQLGLDAYPKTSGSKGLQLYVPLNGETSYERTKPFALAVAGLMERHLPDLVVSRMKKDLRGGKVLIDWSQNDEHKTTIGVYSLRARELPTVSTPVSWDEVVHCEGKGAPDLLRFVTDDVLRRVERDGDLFAPLLTQVQELPELGG
ncbi:DNA ligase D [Patulibacter sp. SYSU D01012]|uniref:DNA ligase D n=1 Tax=Patulibacter sp. SYSU D01012 TaxID=2817381 RepID=UPI001B30F91A|nr:DNA ligase D [Patulibacter sp. SYSU D01012]